MAVLPKRQKESVSMQVHAANAGPSRRELQRSSIRCTLMVGKQCDTPETSLTSKDWVGEGHKRALRLPISFYSLAVLTNGISSRVKDNERMQVGGAMHGQVRRSTQTDVRSAKERGRNV